MTHNSRSLPPLLCVSRLKPLSEICSLNTISKQAKINRVNARLPYFLLLITNAMYKLSVLLYKLWWGTRESTLQHGHSRSVWWSVIFPVVTVSDKIIVTFQPEWRSRRQLLKQSARVTVADTRIVTISLHNTHEHKYRDYKACMTATNKVIATVSSHDWHGHEIVTISSRDRNRDDDIQRFWPSRTR